MSKAGGTGVGSERGTRLNLQGTLHCYSVCIMLYQLSLFWFQVTEKLTQAGLRGEQG